MRQTATPPSKKFTMFKNGIIFTALLLLSVAALHGCADSGFNRAERRLIRQADGGIMRVVTTAEMEDSLFLRQPSAPLDEGAARTAHYRMLKESMLATVLDTLHPGVGIAAPQVGIGRRLIAVQRFDKPGKPFEFYANPVITAASVSLANGREGCLSIPDKWGIVTRRREITLTYNDSESFERVTETVGGYTAVIFQHEIDHLDGKLYTDRAVRMFDNKDKPATDRR